MNVSEFSLAGDSAAASCGPRRDVCRESYGEIGKAVFWPTLIVGVIYVVMVGAGLVRNRERR